MATSAAAIPLGRPSTGTASKGLVRFAWAVVGYNVLVILWGALVRATGSGAGCGNHWPLCNGQVIPLAPRIDTVIEFTHRMMVSGATFAILGLLAWTFYATVKGSAARVMAVVSTILLFNEAFLGALLVKLGYVTGNQSVGRVVLLSIHLSNTLILLAALTVTAVVLGTGQMWSSLRNGRNSIIVLFGILATLIVGVSGSLAALGDTLFPSTSLSAAMAQDFATGSPWLLRVRWVHPASAVLAGAFVIWLVAKAWTTRRIPALWVVGLLAFQFGLGLLDMLLLAPVWMQIIHLLGADLYWVAIVMMATGWVWPASPARQAI
ncbi:COX15/CtaA family protein [Granulicella sibirica]|uniref:COX15/CtaA family protein n=1 Tax=Granulicella sibirica TaxID=2479048 RepID=UPI001008CB44|nr:COX15/CtaA family protein [Granulicella sibirica]